MANRYYCTCKDCQFPYIYTNGGLKRGCISTYFCFGCLTLTEHSHPHLFNPFKPDKSEPPRYLTYFLSAIRRLKNDLYEKEPELVEKIIKGIYSRFDPRNDETLEPLNEIEAKYFDKANSDYDDAITNHNKKRLKPKEEKKPSCRTCSNENIFEMNNKNCPLCGGKPKITSRALLD